MQLTSLLAIRLLQAYIFSYQKRSCYEAIVVTANMLAIASQPVASLINNFFFYSSVDTGVQSCSCTATQLKVDRLRKSLFYFILFKSILQNLQNKIIQLSPFPYIASVPPCFFLSLFLFVFLFVHLLFLLSLAIFHCLNCISLYNTPCITPFSLIDEI